MICLICQNRIEKDERKFMIANDRPYFNVYVHKGCYDSIEDIDKYILENLQKFRDFYRKNLKNLATF